MDTDVEEIGTKSLPLLSAKDRDEVGDITNDF